MAAILLLLVMAMWTVTIGSAGVVLVVLPSCRLGFRLVLVEMAVSCQISCQN
ncbi:Cytochrome c heme lyase subunit CcmH [Corchorus capsularis]|uniref:Cytochrome c heme lyase subunit CcmH n=1 Tax=Corchorus capsularis TaxID=210143 RepID=A0A1R3I4K7_COCAP|nr:Cytochrome c heme lyase subunit CcmH [Corchorus capsularis]